MFPAVFPIRGRSSDGRALAQHARGTGIDTRRLHEDFSRIFVRKRILTQCFQKSLRNHINLVLIFFLAFLCACLKGLKLYQERSNFPFVARVLILLNINVQVFSSFTIARQIEKSQKISVNSLNPINLICEKIMQRQKSKKTLHRPGIEPGPPAWQASILPLNQRC